MNMSYYVDPWLFNCTDNPADSPEDQLEQQTIITAVQRALDYAHRKGVTLIAAAGNEAIDYTKPQHRRHRARTSRANPAKCRTSATSTRRASACRPRATT